MRSVVADTQSLVWYLASPAKLSASALEALELALVDGGQIHVPSISLVEIVYLVERGKLPVEFWRRLLSAIGDGAGELAIVSLDCSVAQAVRSISRHEIPEMPDRVVAATALSLGLPLVTSDLRIRASSVRTIW